jgi:hypothetical protein
MSRLHKNLGIFAPFAALLLIVGCAAQGADSGASLGAAAAPPAPAVEEEPPPPPERFPKPEFVRGIYLTAWSAGSTRKMERMVELLESTELNSVVIDVRDSGNMYWKTGIELAEASGSNQIAIVNPEPLFETLEKHGIYPIARISCFRDKFVPIKFLDRAVQLPNGQPWKDRSGHAWLDPYNKKNWEYLAEVVDFALDMGFPEIQLDYVRFPSEGKASTQNFPGRKSYPNPDATPQEVIADFARFIREKVHARGAVLSADLFGIISSGGGDQGIGQELMSVSEPFDLICPMVYPSHYAKGEYGVSDPNRQPYEIVFKSLYDFRRRLPDTHVRPWLQDFSLFGVKYGVAEVQAQIKAAKEIGYQEYLLWNANNNYTAAAVKDTSKLADPERVAEVERKLKEAAEAQKGSQTPDPAPGRDAPGSG